MSVILHQFAYSHFNEKVRWALAYKQIPHERQTYLPGPHIPAIKKLSQQKQTPVLQIGDRFFAGSALIIDVLEREYSDCKLYPEDEETKAQALRTQEQFDQVVGPAIRTVFFSKLIQHGAYICNMFAGSKPLLTRLAYRAMFPIAKPLIAKGNGVADPDNVSRAFEIVDETLESVAQKVRDTGYMAGGEFSVADLTAAALMAPLVSLSHEDMARPEPIPANVAQLVESYSTHPAIHWTRDIFHRYRPNVQGSG